MVKLCQKKMFRKNLLGNTTLTRLKEKTAFTSEAKKNYAPNNGSLLNIEENL